MYGCLIMAATAVFEIMNILRFGEEEILISFGSAEDASVM